MRLLPIAAMTVACFVNATAMPKDHKVGSMQIISPWSRATPKGASTAIGYMAIVAIGYPVLILIEAPTQNLADLI